MASEQVSADAAVDCNQLPQKRLIEPAPAAREQQTILVVDDDASVLEMTALLLQNAGFRVLQASSGPHALQVWKGHRSEIDMLLTDVVMPGGMSGWDLVRALRQQDPHLRVLVMSGYSPELPAGQNLPILHKPYQRRGLIEAVQACLTAV